MFQFINVIFFLFLLFMQWPDLYKILVICEQEYNVYLKKIKSDLLCDLLVYTETKKYQIKYHIHIHVLV